VPAPWRLNPGGAQSARIGNPRPRALGVGVLGRHGQRRGAPARPAGPASSLTCRKDAIDMRVPDALGFVW